MFVELGKIVGVWGVKGWVKLHSYTRDRADIANYSQWWLQAQSSSTAPKQFEVLHCRIQGQGVVAQLRGIQDRDHAALLTGQRILVKQSDLPKLAGGEYYWKQLIGMTVSTIDNADTGSVVIGKIAAILETGANDVLVVKSDLDDKEDVLIPYIEQVIKEVDLDMGILLVDWDPDF